MGGYSVVQRRRIAVVTGTRAEYGLLYWLMKEIQSDQDLQLQIVVTGMHLSPEFGLTFHEIENDGFTIDDKIEMLLSSDTAIGISKSIGLGIISFAESFNRLNPDLIIVLGDRFETLSGVIAATVARIPLAHINGGELTLGAYDESIRHSITKMSHWHFTSTEAYRRRVIQLGENPDHVFNVGATGIDNIRKLKLLDREQFENSINFKLGKRNILITFHPATLDETSVQSQFSNVMLALSKLQDTNFIFTKPNADTGGRVIIQLIDKFTQEHRSRAIAFTSMGQVRYLSAIQHSDCVVGNSSSGIIEVPSFKKATVNIGDRQQGRIMASSIVNCEPEVHSILAAIEKVFSEEFQTSLASVQNPYDKGGASASIKKCLKRVDLRGVLKKRFFDVQFKV
jgi:GDP/UDP-N,N'-diacetylbacillosamine 2-epimerase (hydrolysing)